MKRIPDSDSQRQQASDKLRFGMPEPALPAIVSFIQSEFVPVDDAWRTAQQRLHQALAAETVAADTLEAAQEAAITTTRTLANRMLDPLGRIDHEGRAELFGDQLADVLRGNAAQLATTLARALARLLTHPHPAADPEIRAQLAQQLETLETARHTAATAQANARQARSTVQQQRELWDEAYRRVVQCALFHAPGNEWRAYLLTFREKKEAEVVV